MAKLKVYNIKLNKVIKIVAIIVVLVIFIKFLSNKVQAIEFDDNNLINTSVSKVKTETLTK